MQCNKLLELKYGTVIQLNYHNWLEPALSYYVLGVVLQTF